MEKDQKFIFSSKYKIIFIILILIGVISLLCGIFLYKSNTRFWGNLLLNSFYFNALALSGVVFVAVHAISESGWHTSIQRIPEAMGTYLPVSAVLLFIVILFGLTHIYHWTHVEHYDPIIEGKRAFLNIPFFFTRYIVYFAGWILFSRLMRRNSLLLDSTGDLKYLKRHNTFAALFVVFFAITVSASGWDWLMSIDVHWFSTMYGWYIFSGLLVSGVAMIIIIVLVLKSAGLLIHVNKEHLHDLGKYLFAFSIFWTYLWFAQYLLIWYSNLPEETIYFAERLKEFNTLFFVNLIMNFAAPFLILMTRNSKRIPWILGAAAVVVFIGHWIDLYQIIMPGLSGKKPEIGFFEIGLTLGYLGLFLFIVFRALSKTSLVPEKHPFFKESLEYHTNY